MIQYRRNYGNLSLWSRFRKGDIEAGNFLGDSLSDPKDYDPLMACNWMIMSEGLRQGGLYIMTQKEDGTQYCPVCEAIIHNSPEDRADIEKFWINGPANAALEVCRERGLVPGVQ